MGNEKIRILVADDHNLFRSGIISILSEEKEIFIIGEAETGEELIDKYFRLKPDIVLADISMPDMTGIEALEKILRDDSSAKFLFLSMHEGDEYIYYCYNAGGMGLISKKVLKGELLFALKVVYENKKYFGVDVTEERLRKISDKYKKDTRREIKKDGLTPREKQILNLISEGCTSNEIAEKLFLSKRTIDSHRTHLMQKLNLKSFPELIKYAINFSSEAKNL